MNALITRVHLSAGDIIAETLWPTRCAVCDTPGDILCDRCRLHLRYVDWWRACERCGAPYGRVQCTECNKVMLAAAGRSKPAHDGCASAVTYDDAAARIVRTWKDGGERRLVHTLASLMMRVVPPAWVSDAPTVLAIPATAAARRRRGFDHGQELAQEVGLRLNLRVASVLDRPRNKDQRALARRGRLKNMDGRFHLIPHIPVPSAVVLVDDVCTTGATLAAAADALRAAGATSIRCLTFARVW